MGLMEGKVALVTGGSSGIGLATARAFANEGAQVMIASRSKATGEAAAQEINAAGGRALWHAADVSQNEQAASLVETTIQHFGRLDYAFNNAGSGGKGGWLEEVQEADWDQTINGYLKSVYLCMKYEIQRMLAGGGVIVNNSSVDGERACPSDPAYSAAKHGVIGLTKSTALQYANRGIRINAVCPGWIHTQGVEDMILRDPQAKGRMLAHQPIGHLGQPEEVAQAVIWLCSEKASFVTGVSLPVDGGYLVI